VKCLYCGQEIEFNPNGKKKYCSELCKIRCQRERQARVKTARLHAERRDRFLSATICPWALGEIRGAAANADPVLGF